MQLDHGLVLHCRILVAEQAVRRFILLDFWEATHGWIEAVVGIIVVALATLTEQDSTRTRFDLEIVIHILLDMDAFTRRELYLRPGRNGVGSAVAVDSHVGFFANGLVGQAVVDADEDIAAAVDDVLGLVPMEMIWGILSLFHVQQLLGVDLWILVGHFAVAVADRDERHTNLVEIAKAVIGNVPAEHTVADFIVFMPLGFPFFRREVAERRQEAMLACAHSFEFF